MRFKYFQQSELPLSLLTFLLPLIVLYEIGTIYFASDWSRHTETRVLAFNLCGSSWPCLRDRALSSLLCGAVHPIELAHRAADPWKFQVGTNFLMCIESAACMPVWPWGTSSDITCRFMCRAGRGKAGWCWRWGGNL
jgi:hypothetical protein